MRGEDGQAWERGCPTGCRDRPKGEAGGQAGLRKGGLRDEAGRDLDRGEWARENPHSVSCS